MTTQTSPNAITVERTVAVPVARLWRALTAIEDRVAWAGGGDHPAVVQGTSFTGADGSGGTFLEVVEHDTIRHTWQRPGKAPELITWTLRAEGDGTRIRFEHAQIADEAEVAAFTPMWAEAVDGLVAYLQK